jgi:regulator of protease activity HflC (stomatin/prohibitin superfamily)
MSSQRKAAAQVFQAQNVRSAEDEQAEVISQEKAMGLSAPAPGYVASPMPQAPARKERAGQSRGYDQIMAAIKTSEELQLEKEPLQVRETGLWLWRRILVPPNAYVVHTRMGKVRTLGLGTSFRYNPYTDSYLIVPAAMQTIGVVANCISKEKQGINVLAYVQWQIDDFSVAYRKLDFSDSRYPLGIVNAQLGEQAEAAIKDKISTMSVEEVLTDKAPIIVELTTRLKAVAEGRQDDQVSEGLGIKIVTVQIKEALVSSQNLWEDLQAPFRHQQEKTARISYLSTQDEIQTKELATKQAVQTREAETRVEIERITQSKETEAAELRLAEEGRRFSRTQEAQRQKVELEEQTTIARQESAQRVATQEKRLEVEQALQVLTEEGRLAAAKLEAEQKRIEQETTLQSLEATLAAQVQAQTDTLAAQVLEAQLGRQREEHEVRLALERENNQIKIELLEKEVEVARLRQEVHNLVNERDLTGRLIEKLPELAAHMPDIQELKVLQTGNGDASFDALASFLSKMLALSNHLGLSLPAGQQGANGQEE